MSKFQIAFVLLLILSVFAFSQTIPPAPENLTATATIEGFAKLRWYYPNIMGINFKIYKSIDNSPFISIQTLHMNSYIDMAVPAGHIYRYYVTAINTFGESQPSNDITFIPDSTSPPPMFKKGFIQGNIIDDSTGLPIKGVRVRFYNPDGLIYFRETCTDTFGNYIAPLDSGVYLIYATKWTFAPELYDNATSPADATPVAVNPRDTSTANFQLNCILLPPANILASVSGTVIDSVSGLPIKDAFVIFMRTNRQINMMMNYNGPLMGSRDEMFVISPLGTLLGVVGKAKTDENGNYTLYLPKGFSYIAVAAKPGYIPEFYNNKSTPLEADRILITSDTTGINFDLILNPEVQNSLSGTVKNSEGLAVFSRVVLFQKTTKGIRPVRYTMTDTLGNFYFNFLYSGYYFAKAVPVTFYAPAWYDANPDSCGVICWVNADSFLVQNQTSGINICVVPFVPSGFARIVGSISSTEKISNVQGATVYANNVMNNQIAGYDITENDGSFEINYLVPGTYQVVVDKEGYTNESAIYDINSSNNYSVSNAEIVLTSITLNIGSEKDIPVSYYLAQNYPNPFNPTTEIKFGIPKTSNVSIGIYNILGQKIATLLNSELNAGNYSVIWDGKDISGRNVSTGIYFYKLETNSIDGTVKFTNVKKMMLSK